MVDTKAAVIPIELEQGYYFLGKKTADLIEKTKYNPISVNAVIMRSQKREHERAISAV